ncbi:MAG TPA: hypothetical protein VI030_03290 [Propionibacteriaceae bacterium]
MVRCDLATGLWGDDRDRLALQHRFKPAGYPNGRTLTDDVFNRLAFVAHGQVLGDRTGPHSDLLEEFPYRGHPHVAEVASSN